MCSQQKYKQKGKFSNKLAFDGSEDWGVSR